MVNDFVYSVRSLGLMFGLSNNERKGTKKYTHTQVSEYFFEKIAHISFSRIWHYEKHLLPLHLKFSRKS